MPKGLTANILKALRKPQVSPLEREAEMTRKLTELSMEQHKLRRDIERASALLLKYEKSVVPPSSYYLELLVPMGVTKDFLVNLAEIYDENWVPKFGEKRARRLWHRQCIGLVVLHWFNVVTSAAERLRKVFYSWG